MSKTIDIHTHLEKENSFTKNITSQTIESRISELRDDELLGSEHMALMRASKDVGLDGRVKITNFDLPEGGSVKFVEFN